MASVLLTSAAQRDYKRLPIDVQHMVRKLRETFARIRLPLDLTSERYTNHLQDIVYDLGTTASSLNLKKVLLSCIESGIVKTPINKYQHAILIFQ